MSKFIELTDMRNSLPVWVNASKIIWLEPHLKGKGTFIVFSVETTALDLEVEEDFATVKQKIDANG